MAKVAGKVTDSTTITQKKSLDAILLRRKATQSMAQESNGEHIDNPIGLKDNENVNPIDSQVEPINESKDISFAELKDLFGDGFSENEYRDMYKKYMSLQINYPLRTIMHKEALIIYVKYAFKRDQAIANDDIEAADKWGKLCQKAQTDAKLNPSQLSAADLSDGISNFGKLVEAVEKTVDIIPLLPRWLQEPQDGLDYYIWQQTQYLRRLENKPLTKYSDLYNFMGEQYDRFKSKYDFIAREENGHFDEEESDF